MAEALGFIITMAGIVCMVWMLYFDKRKKEGFFALRDRSKTTKNIIKLFFTYFSPILSIIVIINNSDFIRLLCTTFVLVSSNIFGYIGGFENKICRRINSIKEVLAFIMIYNAIKINTQGSYIFLIAIFLLAILVTILDGKNDSKGISEV